MDTKKCGGVCGLVKPISEFGTVARKNSRSPTWQCLKCQVGYNRKRLQDPTKRVAYLAYQKKYQKEYGRKRRQERFAFLDELKKNPCTDCGHPFPPECMDFDHIDPEAKFFDVSRAIVSGTSLEKVRAEVAKCRIICANCHRIRTARMQRRNRFLV